LASITVKKPLAVPLPPRRPTVRVVDYGDGIEVIFGRFRRPLDALGGLILAATSGTVTYGVKDVRDFRFAWPFFGILSIGIFFAVVSKAWVRWTIRVTPMHVVIDRDSFVSQHRDIPSSEIDEFKAHLILITGSDGAWKSYQLALAMKDGRRIEIGERIRDRHEAEHLEWRMNQILRR
jgi:hypothetical protein